LWDAFIDERSSYSLRIATGKQGYEWPHLKCLWETADRAGYDSLWTGDHLYAIFGEPSRPNFEGWSTLAALSQRTTQARIGSLVNCNGFRNPCLTAKMAVTLDHVSAGRFILGIGAGWFEQEHRSLGSSSNRQGTGSARSKRPAGLSGDARGREIDSARQILRSHRRPMQSATAPGAAAPLMIAGQGEKTLLKSSPNTPSSGTLTAVSSGCSI